MPGIFLIKLVLIDYQPILLRQRKFISFKLWLNTNNYHKRGCYMDMELLRYYPTSKMQQATLLALWMTLAAHLMRTKTCTGKVNETSDFIDNPFA